MRLIFWRMWRKFGVNPLLGLEKIKQFQGVEAFFSTCHPCPIRWMGRRRAPRQLRRKRPATRIPGKHPVPDRTCDHQLWRPRRPSRCLDMKSDDFGLKSCVQTVYILVPASIFRKGKKRRAYAVSSVPCVTSSILLCTYICLRVI